MSRSGKFGERGKQKFQILRHSFANWLKDAGVPTADIQTLLRHRDQRTTAGYLHTSTQQKITAIARLPVRDRTA